jgi:hypothetical protein
MIFVLIQLSKASSSLHVVFHLHYRLVAPQPLHVPQPRHGRMPSSLQPRNHSCLLAQ